MVAPYIIAIDPATVSGFCHGRVGERPILLSQRFRFAGYSDEELYGAATSFFAQMLLTYKPRKPALVAIEAPIMAAWGKTNAQTTAITRGLYAIFTGIAVAKNIPILRADIGTWRKYFLGRGNLKGAEAKRQCVDLCNKLGWSVIDHNCAEAAGIWCWASSQIAPANAQRIEPLFARSAA